MYLQNMDGELKREIKQHPESWSFEEKYSRYTITFKLG
jgi:rRNA maturation protein Nop10